MNRTLRRLRGRALGAAYQAGGWAAWAALRPRVAGVDRSVVVETWDAVADGAHNSNTDLTFFDGWFYLAHQTSPHHTGSRSSRMLLWRSRDAHAWEKVTEFRNPKGEYRDPTFGQIKGRLFLYMLPNAGWRAIPYTTTLTSSTDGVTWSEPRDIENEGWLFWRPKTRDGVTWYVTAYWTGHGRCALFSSRDGETWTMVSQIHEATAATRRTLSFCRTAGSWRLRGWRALPTTSGATPRPARSSRSPSRRTNAGRTRAAASRGSTGRCCSLTTAASTASAGTRRRRRRG